MDMDLHLRASIQAKWEWPVHIRGYKWKNCNPSPWFMELKEGISLPQGPFLVPGASPEEFPDPAPLKTTYPLEDTALFAKFGDLSSVPESFALWASQYGMLLGKEEFQAKGKIFPLFVRPWEEDGIRTETPAETLELWQEAHRELACAATVWELWHYEAYPDIKQYRKNNATLESTISWFQERGRQGIRIRVGCTDIADEIQLYSSEASDCRTMASIYLREKIKKKLTHYPIITSFAINEEERLGGVLQPSSLLAAMWYQLLRAVKNTDKGVLKLRRCQNCGKWESLKKHRSDWRKHQKCPQDVDVRNIAFRLSQSNSLQIPPDLGIS